MRDEDIKRILLSATPKKSKTSALSNPIVIILLAVSILLTALITTAILTSSNLMIGSSSKVTINHKESNSYRSSLLTSRQEWSSFSPDMKRSIRAEMIGLHPSIFGPPRISNHWTKISKRMFSKYNIIHSQPRDLFRSKLEGWPPYFARALKDKEFIKQYLSTTPKSQLILYWGQKVPGDTYLAWLSLVEKYTAKRLGKKKASKFVKEMLKDQ